MGQDEALGCLLGAAVGDAVGAFLEFARVTPEGVEMAMTLPGGGVWEVGPGQFTDDTELALCLAHGLAGHNPSAGFPADSVAAQYAWWYNKSRPFDVGTTTRMAFRLPYEQTTSFAAVVQDNVKGPVSQSSKSNGATMRSTPLAIWGHTLCTEALAACAKADAQLSHPNQTCLDANAAYVIAAASLIRRPGDAEAALEAAEQWAAAHACPEVQEWLRDARNDRLMVEYDANSAMGFVRHAILLAFYHLRRQSGFEEGLRHTLLCGGDTDTNAAIVCGLLGALHGARGIPASLRSQVESYEWGSSMPHGGGVVRPPKLRGVQIAPLAAALFQDALAAAC